MFEGFDDSVDVYYRGKFDLMYFEEADDETPWEMLEKLKLTTSGDNDMGQEVIEMMQGVGEIIGRVDPSFNVLPYGMYRQFPISPSMELHTACGRQNLHVHCEGEGKVIQFYRPRNDKYWYDKDQLKGHLTDAFLREMELFSKLMDPSQKVGFFERFRINGERRKLNKLCKLHSRLLRDPEVISRIHL